MSQVQTATIAAQDTGTAPVQMASGAIAALSISLLSASTITLQHRHKDAAGVYPAGWLDVPDGIFTVDTEQNYEAGDEVQIRLWCKTGDYVADSPVLRVGALGADVV